MCPRASYHSSQSELSCLWYCGSECSCQSTLELCIDTDVANFALQAYLHVQVGMNALDDACYNKAADHFTSAVKAICFSSTLGIHSKYDVFVVVG